MTLLCKNISNFAKIEQKNHESTRKSASKIIFFDTKNDHQCIVIYVLFKKKGNKFKILSLIFEIIIKNINKKIMCLMCIGHNIFKAFRKKSSYEEGKLALITF